MENNFEASHSVNRLFENVPKCGAKTRSGEPCKKLGMKNGRCKFHGGKSTGPKTLEGKLRAALSNYKHGFYSKAAKEERRQTAEWIRQTRQSLGIDYQ
jgi:hypothetical protein